MFAKFVPVIALLCLLCACAESDASGEKKKPYQNLLRDEFNGVAPSAIWSAVGPGTVMIDATTGDPSPALMLAMTGVQSGLVSGPLDATANFSVQIAIDPALGSGAGATFVLRNPATSVVVASVTVEEAQITYVMGTAAPVVAAWATDGNFHTFEFVGSASTVSGGHWWKRDGAIVATHLQPMAATSMTVGLEGPSSGAAWFDNAWVYHRLAYPH